MTRLSACAVVLLACLPCAAREGADGKGDWPCQSDSDRLCAGVEPGGGRLVACLKEHKDELSQECKASWEQKKKDFKQGGDEAMQACKDDKEKFCADVQPGGGAIIKCMQEHKDELSDKCRSALAKKKAVVEHACKDDKEKFCADVQPGGGAIMNCMKEHKDELSEKCAAMMSHKAQGRKEGRGKKSGSDE